MIALLFPLAHAGHWINGFLYLSPVLVIAALLFFQSRRDRKAGDDEDEDRDRDRDRDPAEDEDPPTS